jgi:hypothetical protein
LSYMRAADCSFATEGSRQYSGLQPPVAKNRLVVATVRRMPTTKASDYWREVCAPILKRRKDSLGRKVPERLIAAAVEEQSGKNTTRGALNLFLLGEREPYISQFIALCNKLGLTPLDVLAGRLVVSTSGAEDHTQNRKFFNTRNTSNIPISETNRVKGRRKAKRN